MEDIPFFPVVYVDRLAALMVEEGLDADSILRDSGISPNLLRRPESLLTLRQAHALFKRYLGLSSHSLPALRFGQRLDLITHGLMGHIYCWRGDFRGLIDSIAAYLRVRLPLLDIALSEGGDYLGLRLAWRSGSPTVQKFLTQVVLGSFYELCRSVAPNMAIHCHHDLFEDVAQARHLLQAELNTDHDGVELRFYASAAAREPALAGRAEAEPVADPFEQPAFVVRLRNELLSHLRGDDSADAIASAVGMSVRTLRRRLADCGLNFNKVRLDVRMQVAQRYLTTTRISIERIAGLVGYSDQAAFTRAFREWKGDTPAALRQQRARDLVGDVPAPAPTAPRPSSGNA